MAGNSGRIGVFQLTGDVQDLDANQRVILVVKDDRVIQLRLAVRRMGVLLEGNIKRIDIVLIIKAERSIRQLDPRRGQRQELFSGGRLDPSLFQSLRHIILGLSKCRSIRAVMMKPSVRLSYR